MEIINKNLFFKTVIFLSIYFLIGIKVFSGGKLSMIFSLTLFSLPVVLYFIRAKFFIHKNKEALIFYVLIFLLVISSLRQYMEQDISFVGAINSLAILLSIIFVIYFSLTNANFGFLSAIKLLRNALGIYVILNLLLFLVGITGENIYVSGEYGNNEILSFFSIYIQRVLFVLAPNLAYYAMTSGVLVLISLSLFIKEKNYTNITLLILGTISILLTDARGPVFALLLFIIIILFFKKLFIRFSTLLTLFLITSVFFYTGIIEFLNNYYDLDSVARENSSLLSNREIIWETFFQKYDPSLFNLCFGYGNVGQLSSGISAHYSYLFSRWDNALQISLHNSSLQTLVDIGIVGLTFWTIVLISINRKMIHHYRSTKMEYFLIVPIITNYLLLTGITDIVLNLSNVIIFYIILYLITLSIVQIKTTSNL